MGQVAITVNGRSYRFDCGDGEEPRLQELAEYVKSRMETLSREGTPPTAVPVRRAPPTPSAALSNRWAP